MRRFPIVPVLALLTVCPGLKPGTYDHCGLKPGTCGVRQHSGGGQAGTRRCVQRLHHVGSGLQAGTKPTQVGFAHTYFKAPPDTLHEMVLEADAVVYGRIVKGVSKEVGWYRKTDPGITNAKHDAWTPDWGPHGTFEVNGGKVRSIGFARICQEQNGLSIDAFLAKLRK